jgi:tetratricopeptide (TPR) repeat protein
MENKQFGALLSEGLSSVARRQHKTIASVKRDVTGQLVDAGFRLTGSTISGWCQGIVPKDHRLVEFIARYCMSKGRVDRAWVESLLNQGRYPEREAFLKELYQVSRDTPASQTPQEQSTPQPAHLDDPVLPTRPLAGKGLVGRQPLLGCLTGHLLSDDTSSVALYGLPGVGKTTLAVALAHRQEIRERFCDGILWANLGQQPNLAGQLGRWGSLLSLTAAELATCANIDELARVVRTAIGTRRLLIVIDDAWTTVDALACQVGGPHCAYLLTTRFAKIALHCAGSEAFGVHELTEEESVQLLSHLAPAAVAAQPELARELAQLVGGLPLALTLLGRYLQGEAYSGQQRRLLAAFEQVRQRAKRLQLAAPRSLLERQPNLPVGASLSLEVSIGTSYQALSPRARSLLLALAVFPPRPSSFSEEAAITVGAASPSILDAVIDAGLLESSGSDRYTLHQTIADFARLKGNNPKARERFVTFFLGYIATHATNYSALDREASNILAALEMAFEQRRKADLVQGVVELAPFLLARGLYEIAVSLLTRTHEVAQAPGDSTGQMKTLLLLGKALKDRGDYAQAASAAQKGVNLAREAASAESTAAFLQLLGVIASKRGEYAQAEAYALEGLAIARQVAHQGLISACLLWLGVVSKKRGEYAQSVAFLEEGLAAAQLAGDQERISMFLLNLGQVELNQGKPRQANVYYRQGLASAQAIGNRQLTCCFLMCLGLLANRQGELASAKAWFEEGLAIARTIGHREHTSGFLQCLGELAAQRGDFTEARSAYQEGLVLARAIEHRDYICDILTSLGELELDQGDEERAEPYLLEGLALAHAMQHRARLCQVLVNLARYSIRHGNVTQAERYIQEAQVLARELHHHLLTINALRIRGEVSLRLQDLDVAKAAYQEAFEMAAVNGYEEQSALAMYGLAQVAAAQGCAGEAYQKGQECLRTLEAIGNHRAVEVRQWLAEMEAAGVSR